MIQDVDGSNLVHLATFSPSSRSSSPKSSQSIQFDKTSAAELLRIFLEADLVSDQLAGIPAAADATQLVWEKLSDSGFERLLFDLFRRFPRYQNVEWLTHTRAPDRGRDLSAERVIVDDGGTTRTERVLIQAKHWRTKSIGPADLHATVATLPLWQPPVIRGLIIATTGRFTADAVALAEQHNNGGKPPYIELWTDNRIEALLEKHPDLVSRHRLREQ
ncbi:restriction endonuclease [Nocardia nova]|uniref:restriction endonuclease n=1 Tax=Nocardia nova TaxID=37330 RepID=UPI0025B1776A|nr:restriction endonuclease [Nocardia nova]